MPKRKLFHGSNYVGAPLSDKTYRALRLNALYHNVSISDLLRVVMDAWAESPHAAIPPENLIVVELALEELMAQRKKNGPGRKD